MYKGKCTKCNATYTGWALSNPEHQFCPRCNCRLVLSLQEETRAHPATPAC